MALQNEIEQGVWAPGEQIPTERQLVKEHNVSIGTVKKAVMNLVHEGFLYRVQGKGTFVAGTEMRRKRIRYYNMLRRPGDKPASMDIELLSIRRIPGQLPDNRYLKISVNQELFELRRLFRHDGKPLILTESVLPAKMFPGLDSQNKSFFELRLLYTALEDNYGVTTVANQELFSAVAADADTAEIFGIQEGRPMLFMEMLSYTYKEKPYEYRRGFCLSDERKIAVKL
jgi:GntR family transcriptional regulator